MLSDRFLSLSFGAGSRNRTGLLQIGSLFGHHDLTRNFGPACRSRTCDLLIPNQARYQAALMPDYSYCEGLTLASRGREGITVKANTDNRLRSVRFSS